ncbi:FKBP-type peptidyl-prolyl cis-trans isomerase, partial [Escherichia coli]|nr:FKBP-type peptidyl-prolyl cis-trans isomerase [Escherichia coli]
MNHVSPLLFASLLALAAVSTQAASPASETLPSGVIVQTLTKGTGPSPKASDTVKV